MNLLNVFLSETLTHMRPTFLRPLAVRFISGVACAAVAGCATDAPTEPTLLGAAAPGAQVLTALHEPAGLTPLVNQVMSGAWVKGWAGFSSGVRFGVDAKAPMSPAGFARMTYPVGFTGGRAPGTAETSSFTGRSYRELYVRMAFRVSAAWLGHPTTMNKVLHFWTQSPQGNKLILMLNGAGTKPLSLRMTCQGTPNDAACVRMMANTGASGTVARGTWHVVEVSVKLNTKGRYDGLLKVWLDGRQTHNYTNLRIDAARWHLLAWSPTWGGMGFSLPAQQTMDVDGLYVSGR